MEELPKTAVPLTELVPSGTNEYRRIVQLTARHRLKSWRRFNRLYIDKQELSNFTPNKRGRKVGFKFTTKDETSA